VQPAGGPFFEHNSLLFLPLDEVRSTTTKLVQARPLANALAHDPSVSGLAGVLTTSLLLPLLTGQVKLSDMRHLLSQGAAVIDRVLANQPAAFSWRALVEGCVDRTARAFITVQPLVDYGALEPGARVASDPHNRGFAATRCTLRRDNSIDWRTAARRRRVRISKGRRGAPRGRRSCHHAGDPVARVALGTHDRSGVHCTVRWTRCHDDTLLDDGRRFQHDFSRVHGAVCRTRGGRRCTVQRQISRGAAFRRPDCSLAGQDCAQHRRAAHACCGGRIRQLLLVSADGLSGGVGARRDCRHRDARRICDQHHVAACTIEGFQSAMGSCFAGFQTIGPRPTIFSTATESRYWLRNSWW